MAKAKEKLNQEKVCKHKDTPSTDLRRSEKAKDSFNEALQYWQDTINSLKSKTFASSEEAVEELVDEVLQTIRISQDQKKEKIVKELLVERFTMDPTLMEEIERILMK